ncbi:MAG TPA: hypothetical protein DCE41_06215 [Cytophagales bacterium]|nr:hypothetical protein [Cytophagales bacterium]
MESLRSRIGGVAQLIIGHVWLAVPASARFLQGEVQQVDFGLLEAEHAPNDESKNQQNLAYPGSLHLDFTL